MNRLKILADLSQIMYPNFGHCYRCGMSWAIVQGHSTQYSPRHGCFPLCEKCWVTLSPKDRLPFYRESWDSHIKQQGKDYDYNGRTIEEWWPLVEKAVMEGK